MRNNNSIVLFLYILIFLFYMNETVQRPLITVGALIFNQNREILLVKTHKWKDKFGLPGGKIDLGETAERALIREIKEETNLDIQNIEFVLWQEVIFSEEFYKPQHFIFFNYTCDTLDETQIMLNDEAQSYVWLGLGEALSLDLNEATRKLISTVWQQSLQESEEA